MLYLKNDYFIFINRIKGDSKTVNKTFKFGY